MSFLYRRKMILAKIEAAAGTDSVPVQADNSILTSNLQVNSYEGDTVERDLDDGILGSYEEFNVGPMASLEFDVELAGPGTVGEAPAYGILLEACGFSETLTPAVAAAGQTPAVRGIAEYSPVSKSFDSLTIYYNVDGQQQKFSYCRGTVSIRLDRGQLPMYHFSMMGLYTRPTAVALYTPDFTKFKVPVPVNFQNTTKVSILGFDAKMESFNWDLNAVIVHRNLPGNDSIEYVDRKPSGTVVLEAPTIATKDLFAAMESHNGVTKGIVDIIHGPVANQVRIEANQTQLTNLREGESDGIMTYSLDMKTIPGLSSGGNDEIKLTIA